MSLLPKGSDKCEITNTTINIIPGGDADHSMTYLLGVSFFTVEVIEHPDKKQPKWQRVVLLSILAYEGLGALAGGVLLVATPEGSSMRMPVEIMHGFFKDFLIPGIILFGLGVLNVLAFFSVLQNKKTDWIWAALATGCLAIWFLVEIVILGELHWLHAMWGLPVIAGAVTNHAYPRKGEKREAIMD